MKFDPYPYQRYCIDRIIDTPNLALWLDMGLGKTVITLTALQDLKFNRWAMRRALVIAPKKVAEDTWSSECRKWDHLVGMRVVTILGTAKQRETALNQRADVYIINRENTQWLVEYCGRNWPFDVVVLDESSSFKNHQAKRFKAMKVVRPRINRVIELTGTPRPHSLLDLWAQMYCLDMGDRLGKSVTRYKETYFDIHKWNNIEVRADCKPGCEKLIRDKIADICLSMQAKDYLQLPDLLVHTERVELSKAIMDKYATFEKEKVLEFKAEHGSEPANVLANSAAGLMNKLSQFANGAVYDEDRNVHEIHDEKLDRLAELVEAANSPVLVFYQYKHDIDRIAKKLKGYRVVAYEGEAQLLEWNAGKIDVLLAHPASTAYGLNMQQGGHYIVWFGTGWNLELYQQANARLHRQGQQHPVTVYKLLCSHTVDERANAALESKKGVQQSLLDSLNYLLRKHNLE